jgi:hypothetical protein
MTQWILVAFAIGGLIYNSIVTHVTMKNDIKHLKEDFDCLRKKVEKLMFHLMDDKNT